MSRYSVSKTSASEAIEEILICVFMLVFIILAVLAYGVRSDLNPIYSTTAARAQFFDPAGAPSAEDGAFCQTFRQKAD